MITTCLARRALPSLCILVAAALMPAGPVSANTAPEISAIADQRTAMETPLTVNFTIGDAETVADDLVVTAASDNGALIDTASIVEGGSGANRSLTLTPAVKQFGTAEINVRVDDGSGAANSVSSLSFTLTVVPHDSNGAATISAVTPGSGSAGHEITITGSGLLHPEGPHHTQVFFPYLHGGWTSAGVNEGSTTTSVKVTVPELSRSGLLALVVDTGAPEGSDQRHIATAHFVVQAEITSVSPSMAPAGVSVVIEGSGFENTTQVLFNGVAAAIEDKQDSYLSVKVPAGATTGPLSVVTSDAGTAISPYNFVVGTNIAPTIDPVADQTTAMETPFTVNFTVGDTETPAANLTMSAQSSDQGLVPNDNIVFGGSGASRTVTITPAPERFGALNIYLRVSDGSGAANQVAETSFRLRINGGTAGTATITGITPAAGRPGDTITITGTGLLGPDDPDYFNATIIYFKNLNGDWVDAGPEEGSSATSLIVTIPASVRSGPVTVTVDTFNFNTLETTHSIATSASNFTFNTVIDSFSPAAGSAGDQIAIEGVGFTNASQVTINGVPAPINQIDRSETHLSVTVPGTASTGLVRVITPDAGIAESAAPFTFTVNDTIAPLTALVISPEHNSSAGSLAGGIHGSAQDDAAGSGISRVDVVVSRNADGGDEYWGFDEGTAEWVWSHTPRVLSATLAAPNALSTAWSLNTGLPAGNALPNGQYRVHAVAWDRGGNSATGPVSIFTVNTDSTPPSVAVSSPAHGGYLR